jgi:hypothetical protein
MTDIQIDKNVEMPSIKRQRKTRRGRAIKWNWPLDKMEVGDSIYVPLTEFSQKVQEGNDHVTHHCNNALRLIKTRNKTIKNYTFAARQILENNKVVGARVWRTA